jgi:hypothetical protein
MYFALSRVLAACNNVLQAARAAATTCGCLCTAWHGHLVTEPHSRHLPNTNHRCDWDVDWDADWG